MLVQCLFGFLCLVLLFVFVLFASCFKIFLCCLCVGARVVIFVLNLKRRFTIVCILFSRSFLFGFLWRFVFFILCYLSKSKSPKKWKFPKHQKFRKEQLVQLCSRIVLCFFFWGGVLHSCFCWKHCKHSGFSPPPKKKKETDNIQKSRAENWSKVVLKMVQACCAT